MPGSSASQRIRPFTCSMTKNMVPTTDSSVHRQYVRGTGTPVSRSAVITRYSRSTACAEGSSFPGGFRRST